MKVSYNRAAERLILQRLHTPAMSTLLSTVRSVGGYPLLFAGAVRDAIHAIDSFTTYAPRDFDIGVYGLKRDEFDTILLRKGGKLNRHGGYLFTKGQDRCDIWRVEETCGLKVFQLPFTLKDTLRSFIIDVNAIALDLQSRKFYDLGSRDALRSRTIGFVKDALIHSHSDFSARAIVLSERLGFSLTPSLRQFAVHNCTSVSLSREYNKQTNLLPQREVLNATSEHQPCYKAAA